MLRVAPLVKIYRAVLDAGCLSTAPLPPAEASMYKSAALAKQQHTLTSVISWQKSCLIWAPGWIMEKNQHTVKGFGWAWVYVSGSCAGTQLRGSISALLKECYTDFKIWSQTSSITPCPFIWSSVIPDKLCRLPLLLQKDEIHLHSQMPAKFRSSIHWGTSKTS